MIYNDRRYKYRFCAVKKFFKGDQKMKKLLAVILSAVLMLGACAFTEGPGAGTCYCLSGVSVVTGDTNIDLSDVEIGVDVMDGEPGAVLMHVDNGDERVCEIGFTQVDDLYIIHLDSPTLGHKDYAIDPVLELATSLDELRNVLIEKLQGMDANQAAQSIFDFFDRAEEAAEQAAEAPEAAEAPVETPEPGLVVNGDIQEMLKESINPDQTVTIDEDITDPDTGELLLPAGEYKVTTFSVDKEHLLQVLGNMTLNGQPIPDVEKMKDENVDAKLEGAIYDGQGDLGAGLGYFLITATDGENTGYSGLSYILTTDEDGKTLAFDIIGDTGESSVDVQFALNEHAVADAAFGPDAIDMDSVVNLSELTAAGEESPLLADLQTLLGDAIGGIVAPIAASMAAEAPAA